MTKLPRRVQRAYQGQERRPLSGYAVVLGTYTALVGLVTAAGRMSGKQLPERIGLGDTVLVSVATHKASRLLTKEAVTSPLRAPFTRFQGPSGEAEINESVRGSGARHALGELLTCPFCVGVWIASAMTAGLVLAPRATRLIATALTVVALSDTLQISYDLAKQVLREHSEHS
ncbi:MAG TPA: DUF1360 domain-containing protein [Pseudonocardiaceae bacterium]|nr:DUF1360 domain-containing protein [Pseudonocardiaceae bacterium]